MTSICCKLLYDQESECISNWLWGKAKGQWPLTVLFECEKGVGNNRKKLMKEFGTEKFVS